MHLTPPNSSKNSIRPNFLFKVSSIFSFVSCTVCKQPIFDLEISFEISRAVANIFICETNASTILEKSLLDPRRGIIFLLSYHDKSILQGISEPGNFWVTRKSTKEILCHLVGWSIKYCYSFTFAAFIVETVHWLLLVSIAVNSFLGGMWSVFSGASVNVHWLREAKSVVSRIYSHSLCWKRLWSYSHGCSFLFGKQCENWP